MGIKRRSNTFPSDFSSSFSIFIHPSFPHLSSYYIQPPLQKKKITYTPPLRYLPVLSCSYPSQRYQQELHRLTAHRLKPNLSHTHCLAALPSTPTPHSSQIFFNPSNVQICPQHKPSMHPPIPPSLLPCQENHLTTPLLWHIKSHMPAPSSQHQRPAPASTPRPCHL